ncbi:MAG: hypothetical protein ACLQNE_37505 [Thermoguttaceae bacterium]
MRDSDSCDERRELKRRLEQAKRRATSRNCEQAFNNFADTLENHSGVVIVMPAATARSLMEDPHRIYSNLEHLLGAEARKTPSLQNDRHRSGVVGTLFGTYGKHLRYGILSLTTVGLSTYGEVHCRLKPIAISDRTSFLEFNSYTFLERFEITPSSPIPPGHRATWKTRHWLALAKTGDGVTRGQTRSDWQDLLFFSDGKNRAKDDFIEAHVFGSFDKNAVEEMTATPKRIPNKTARLDASIAIDLFRQHGAAGRPVR